MKLIDNKVIKKNFICIIFYNFDFDVRSRLALIDSSNQQIESAKAFFVKMEGYSR